jgi:three-Cys-motif partner protein
MAEFFSEMTDASHVKATIVEKYFKAWATVMASKARPGKLGYIDLYSGPGRYEDGSESTPLKILQHCMATPNLKTRMFTFFNDANPKFAQQLTEEIKLLPNIADLTFEPIVTNSAVGPDLVEVLKKMTLIPSLSFVDPWGYKGLSKELIDALTKDWGSDTIFFYNYNRVNAAICNNKVTNHINAIFGEAKAEELRNVVGSLSPEQREAEVMKAVAEVLSNEGKNYVLPFRFVAEGRKSTSHYLIFVTKNPLGYKIMKEIMWKSSSDQDDGVAGFAYLPAEPHYASLFPGVRPLDELGQVLLDTYAGKMMSVKEIYENHNIGTPFVPSNYKEALRRLEDAGQIKAYPSVRPKRDGKKTMGDPVKIEFPS